MDKLVKLATQLGQSLQKRGDMLALAESCTGGMVSAAVTDIAGSSAWFDRGFITYSNAAKQEMLNVSEKTLAQHGAVSEETALAMALGALENSQAHIAASITGIAGPTGGSADKPVGTVCFAWVNKKGLTITATKHYTGNREAVRQQAATQSISGLLDHLLSI